MGKTFEARRGDVDLTLRVEDVISPNSMATQIPLSTADYVVGVAKV